VTRLCGVSPSRLLAERRPANPRLGPPEGADR
jgi:hypothetical protein